MLMAHSEHNHKNKSKSPKSFKMKLFYQDIGIAHFFKGSFNKPHKWAFVFKLLAKRHA